MSAVDKFFFDFIDLVSDVPFGNSDFQNRNAIINDEKTSCRAYRHAALRIMNRLEALRECEYNLRRRKIEIKILERNLESLNDPLQRELLTLEIEHKRSSDPYTRKLIKDAVREIESLFPVIQNIGKLSRDAFEAEERQHYALKHGQQLSVDDDLYSTIVRASLPGTVGEAPGIIALLKFANGSEP